MTPSKIVARLLRHQPALFARLPFTPARCILSTRVAIDVLAAFAIPAEPWSVICTAATPAFLTYQETIAALDAGAPPPPPPPDAWAVTAGNIDRDAELVDVASRGWKGHLVAYVPHSGDLLDLDLQAFARPARGLLVPPVLRVRWPGDARDAAVEGRDETGRVHSVIAYRRDEENQAFRIARDWRSDDPRTRAIVRGLIRAIRTGELPEVVELPEVRVL